MPTLGTSVSQKTYEKVDQIAKENNLTKSQVLKQLIEKGIVVDVNKIKSLEIERNYHLNRIGNYLNYIAKYCNMNTIICKLVLIALMEIQDDIANL